MNSVIMKNFNVKIFLLSMACVVYCFVGCTADASKFSKPHGGYLYEKPKSIFEEERKHAIKPEEAIEEEEKEEKEIRIEEEEENEEKEIRIEEEEKEGREIEIEKEEEEVEKNEEEQEHSKFIHDYTHHHHHHHSSREYLLPKHEFYHLKGENTEVEKSLKERPDLNDFGQILE